MSNEELVQAYQNGDKKALEAIIEQNRGIINKLANKFYIEGTRSIDREDLEQEGIIGLIQAADKYGFNIENPCKFITYAVYWIYQKMNRFMKSKNTNSEVSLNTPIGDDERTELQDYIEGVDYGFENVDEKLYMQQLHNELEEVMNECNTLKEREILKLHYGWDNGECMTLEEIGGLYKVTRERTRQLENKALLKLRHSKWARLKSKEIYVQKRRKSAYSIPGTVESVSFAQKYLCDEVI